MSASNDPRALIQQADKILASAGRGGFLRNFFSSEDKYESAIELYVTAANQFRMNKQHLESGRTYEQAAQLCVKHNVNAHDHARYLTSAIERYEDYPKEAIRCLGELAQHYNKIGNTDQAATKMVKMAELFDSSGDRRSAMEYYDKAGDMRTSTFKITARGHWETAARYMVLENEFDKALETFNKVNASIAKDPKHKHREADVRINKALCFLAKNDLDGAAEVIAKSEPLQRSAHDTTFQDLKSLKEAIESKDQEKFKEIREKLKKGWFGDDKEPREHILKHLGNRHFPDEEDPTNEAPTSNGTPKVVIGAHDEGLE
ncbi:soluble NSF attachment protein [Xylariaceae sp. FL1019]|nr:soluble NSF attachment protein [Xylariaceae sp. FL1019]